MQITDSTKNTLLNAGIFMLIMVVFSGFILYGRSGYDEELIRTQFIYYGFYGVGAILVILFFYFFSKLDAGDTNTYGSGVFFNSPGESPSPEISFFKNTYRLILVVLGVSMILALLATFSQQTYLGVGNLEQQFTQTDNILFNWTMVVTSENAGAFALAAFGIVFLRKKAKQWKMSKTNFIMLSLVVLIVSFMAFGFINHILRYSGSERSMQQVLQFWFLLGAVAWLTGNFIAPFIVHGVNNTYVVLAELVKKGILSGDTLIVYTVVGVLIIGVLLILSYAGKKKDKNKQIGLLG
jgi:hypothetical protein